VYIVKREKMYKIETMKIKNYNEIIALWKDTEGMGINEYDDSKKNIKKFLEKNPDTCFIAKFNKEIIGTIMGGNDGRRGLIYHLMVKNDHRKNGIGKNLLKKVEKNLIKTGIKRIYLLVLIDNETGNKFWEDNGYVVRDCSILRTKAIG